MVSTRTLFVAGLATIAIVTLASVVVVQQMVLQNISKQTQTTFLRSSTAIPTSTAYVLIAYYGLSCLCSGETFLCVSITIANHGYDHVNVSLSDFFVVIGNQQFQYSPKTYSCVSSGPNGILEPTRVLNGLSVQGWLFYEVILPTQTARSTSTGPIPLTGFSLIWDHPSSVNVVYVQQ